MFQLPLPTVDCGICINFIFQFLGNEGPLVTMERVIAFVMSEPASIYTLNEIITAS